MWGENQTAVKRDSDNTARDLSVDGGLVGAGRIDHSSISHCRLSVLSMRLVSLQASSVDPPPPQAVLRRRRRISRSSLTLSCSVAG